MDYKRELEDLVKVVSDEGGSDIHLAVGLKPYIRVSGDLVPLETKQILTAPDIESMVKLILSEENYKYFLEKKELDFSYSPGPTTRFRGNAYFQRGNIGVSLRLIPAKIKTLEELNLPEILNDFASREQGFFLVVGPVGQGKSTTLAAMIELINQNRAEHIITIEDPIEYMFDSKRSIVDQREVRYDTGSFASGLHSMFRQDVNVAMIGEMRDPETISTAVTAAETGHLILSTLHTNSASQTVDRIIDSFPANQQKQIRVQLAGSLLGIFSQRLVPRISGGLIPAYELLVNNTAIANLIREGRTAEIDVIIETSSEGNMVDLNRSLADLVSRGEITVETAYRYALNKKVLDRLLQ